MDELLYYAYKYHGNDEMIYRAFMNHEKVAPWQKEECKEKVVYSYTTILSNDYPPCLKLLPYPPLVLFYKGDLSLLDDKVARNFSYNEHSGRIYQTKKGRKQLYAVENVQELVSNNQATLEHFLIKYKKSCQVTGLTVFL